MPIYKIEVIAYEIVQRTYEHVVEVEAQSEEAALELAKSEVFDAIDAGDVSCDTDVLEGGVAETHILSVDGDGGGKIHAPDQTVLF